MVLEIYKCKEFCLLNLAEQLKPKRNKPIRHEATDESEKMRPFELNVTIIYIFGTVKVCGNYNK